MPHFKKKAAFLPKETLYLYQFNIHMEIPRMDQHIRHFLDALAAGGALASFLGLLQPLLAVIASTLSIIWLSVQLYDRHKRKLAEKLTIQG